MHKKEKKQKKRESFDKVFSCLFSVCVQCIMFVCPVLHNTASPLRQTSARAAKNPFTATSLDEFVVLLNLAELEAETASEKHSASAPIC